jgi:hypothetical protein
MFRRTVGDRLVMSPVEPLVDSAVICAFVLEGVGVKSVAWEHTKRERA